MSESSPRSQEKQNKIEIKYDSGEKNRERLHGKAEKAAEKAKGSLEKARSETEQAISRAEKAIEKHEKAPKKGEKKSRRPAFVSADDKKLTYKNTVKQIQKRMSAPSRAFSKVIHNPVIDKASEVSGKTLARPSGVLGGGIAVVLGLSVSYYSARNAGFELSGSEFIWLLIVGFVLGIIIEWIIKSIKMFAK